MTCDKRLIQLCTGLISAALSACVPYHYIDTYAMAGRVTDLATTRPIANAKVSTISGKHTALTCTDQNGRFSLPALEHWGFSPLITDGYVPNGDLRVEAPGYRSITEKDIGLPRFPRRKPSRKDGGESGVSLQNIRIALAPKN